MSSAQTSFGTSRSGGSTELCTASEKKLHLVAWSDGRSRSNRGSSSDEESQTHDGFIEEDFRAGGPYVCPLPAQVTAFPPGRSLRLLQEESQNIVQQISSVLDRFNVVYHSIGFYGRLWEFETEAEPVPTVLIEATKNSVDEDWIRPSRDIWETLSQFGIRSISVEMFDERAFEPDRYHPVPQTDPIFPIWNTVSDTIIRECDVKGWNSLGCYRIGKNDDGALNPSTILVTVDDVDKDWRYTREDIVSVLDRFRLHGVAVMIRKDEILQFSPLSKKPDLPETALDRNAQVGQSVARKGYHKGHGTFSGWVELLYQLDGKWYVYGLTCSHVVIPDDEPGLATYRVNGVSIGHEMVHIGLQVVSPCDTDLMDKKNSSTERVEKLLNDRRFCELEKVDKDPNGFLCPHLMAELNDMRQQIAIFAEEVRQIDFFLIQNYQYLGYVRCATGNNKFKSHGQELPSVLDWALLSVPEWRQGDNKVLTFNTTKPWWARESLSLMTESSTSMANTDELYKCGRATAYTSGIYGGLKEARFAKAVAHGRVVEQPTREHVLMGHGHGEPFSRPGDSGALVFTIDGVVVGMIIAGHKFLDITYVTPIDDLIEDIKSATGAIDARIMSIKR